MNTIETLEKVIYYHTEGWSKTGFMHYDQEGMQSDKPGCGTALDVLDNIYPESLLYLICDSCLTQHEFMYIFSNPDDVKNMAKKLQLPKPVKFNRKGLVERVEKIIDRIKSGPDRIKSDPDRMKILNS